MSDSPNSTYAEMQMKAWPFKRYSRVITSKISGTSLKAASAAISFLGQDDSVRETPRG